jgi:hypothetical protein
LITRILMLAVLLLTCVADVNAGSKTPRRHTLRTAPPLAGKMVSTGRVELSWSHYGDSLYLERRMSDEDVFSIIGSFASSQREFTDSTLIPNSPAYYRLRPRQAQYLSEYGPECKVVTGITAPPAPILTRISLDSVCIRLPGRYALATPLVVERRINGIYTDVGLLSVASPVLRDGGLRTNGWQYYDLRHEGDHDRIAPSRPDSILMDLATPTDIGLTYVDDHTVRLHWKPAVAFPCSYEVEKRSPDAVETVLVPASANEWTDASLGYDQRCYYRVRARSGEDTSLFSSAVSAYYVLTRPVELRTDPVHDCVVHLSWSAPDSLASYYVIERSSDSLLFSRLGRVNGRAFTYTDSISGRGQKLFYRVLSEAANGRTASSGVVTEYVPQFTDGMAFVAGDDSMPGFYCDQTEVTVRKYLEFCDATHAMVPDEPAFPGLPGYWLKASDFPAVNVSWIDATTFCNWRSLAVGLHPAYDSSGSAIPGADGYRLLKRSEFLRALKSPGDSSMSLQNSEELTSRPQPAPAASQFPTGIHYLLGNVWEWTEDVTSDSCRVILGGAFSTPRVPVGEIPEFCYRADYMSPVIGFRCVLAGGGLLQVGQVR